MLKTIIAGGRDYTLTKSDLGVLDEFAQQFGVTEVVSGCAPGVDTSGEKWAESKGIPIKRFPADWKGLGRKAGPIRNGQMADYADALVAFRGGSGTANMVKQARARGLHVFEVMP